MSMYHSTNRNLNKYTFFWCLYVSKIYNDVIYMNSQKFSNETFEKKMNQKTSYKQHSARTAQQTNLHFFLFVHSFVNPQFQWTKKQIVFTRSSIYIFWLFISFPLFLSVSFYLCRFSSLFVALLRILLCIQMCDTFTFFSRSMIGLETYTQWW